MVTSMGTSLFREHDAARPGCHRERAGNGAGDPGAADLADASRRPSLARAAREPLAAAGKTWRRLRKALLGEPDRLP
jgi:hypothetical protein